MRQATTRALSAVWLRWFFYRLRGQWRTFAAGAAGDETGSEHGPKCPSKSCGVMHAYAVPNGPSILVPCLPYTPCMIQRMTVDSRDDICV